MSRIAPRCRSWLMCALWPLGIMLECVAHAQDTRTVSEPNLPTVCSVLIAMPIARESRKEDDTGRIQSAINKCATGRAVRLAIGNGNRTFTSGPLELKSGVTLFIDAGVTLYATSDPRAYDRGKRTCGTNDAVGNGCKPFITADGTRDSGVMGEGVIDGQGGHLIDGHTETWWQIARRAQKERSRQNVPRLIAVTRSREFTLHRITLRNSPNFHITLSQVDGFTAWGVRIDTPTDARNTDGIDPISSRNITIAHSFIRTGDDNVAIKAGRNGLTENISILHNHFYNGHGMSIGSETDGGVRNVLVEDLTMDGATSGLRIKSDVSRGGLVSNVRYRRVCLRNVRTPIDVGTRYDPQATGSNIPVYKDIAFENVHSMTPGPILLRGFDEKHLLVARLDTVVVDGNATVQAAHAVITLGPGPVQPLPSGDDVQISGSTSNGAAENCDARFVAFPLTTVDAPTASRPQLTPAQAGNYSYQEVLKYSGTAGNETIDPWDPLADPLATGATLKPDYTVDPRAIANGKTVFNTVQSAVNRAVVDSNASQRRERQYIFIKPGLYRELLYVPASLAPIALFGIDADATKTRISANLHAGTRGATYARNFGGQFAAADPSIVAMYAALKNKPIVGTPGSAIAWIRNSGFQARNITFENAWNRSDVVQEVPAAIISQHVQTFNQAVALLVEDADKVQFENVRFLGFQDTLFLTSSSVGRTARSFFNKSYIEGDTDFIFGDATAYFFQTEIKSLGARRNYSYATAPSTNIRRKFGFVFNDCKFTHDGTANALAGNFKLTRQWFRSQKCTPYGTVTDPTGYTCSLGATDTYEAPVGTISKGVLETVGKVIILNSRIGAHIDKAQPWADWNANGTIKHRPAQYDSDDYWDKLIGAGIDPIRQMGYAAKQKPPEPFLAEFNNIDE